MTEKSDKPAFLLPATLNYDVMGDLANFLMAQRGESIVIDGKEGAQIGAQTAQILAVAAQTWAADRASLQIMDPTGQIAGSLDAMGLTETFADVLITDGAST